MSSGSTQAINRAATLLRLLGEERHGVSLRTITQRSGLARSTAHRTLVALEAEGLVHRTRPADAPGDVYSVGPVAAMLAGAARERFIDAASPILRRAAIDLNASVELHLDSGGLIRCIDQGFWPMAGRSDQASQRVGTIATPHASAAGKAVLAHRADIDAIELAPITSHTITERHELEAQLERIRASGIAWERDEVSLGVSAVAVPCRTEHGDLMAVSVTESSDSFRERADQIVPVLLGVRDELAA